MNHIKILDFDGVVASPFEEALFTMPATPHDKEFIKTVSYWNEIDLSSESVASARYICIQAMMLVMLMPIDAGPHYPRARGNFYIMTARCDRFAVKRCHNFIESGQLKPIKIMHTDHLPKGTLIEILLDQHPDTTYTFYDDNPRHIESARALGSERLEVVQVDNDMRPYYDRASSFYKSHLLERVL